MTHPTTEHAAESAIDQRLTELEIKASFSDDLLEQLNQVIVRQQQQIDQLIDAVRRLSHQQASAPSGEPRNLHDELPPHY